MWVTFIGAWVTMMLGSLPQQDVFQRVTSAKSANIAIAGSLLGATIYFCFTFVPMFTAMVVVAFLLLSEPDFGAMMVIMSIAMGVLFLGGINLRIFSGLAVMVVGAIEVSNYM